MDWIALASVITSGVVGLGGLLAALWSTQKNAALAREGRVQERRIDAYLELLRLIEQRTLWYELLYGRLRLAGDADTKSSALPPKPEVGDLVTINTLMVAFGSERLMYVCSDWLLAEQEFQKAHEVAEWNWHEDNAGPDTPVARRDLDALLGHFTNLSAERARIERVISEEMQQIQSGGVGSKRLFSKTRKLKPAQQ